MFDIPGRVLYNTTRVIARCIMLLDVKRIVNTPGGRIPFEFSEDFSDVDFGGVCPAVRPVLVVGQVRNIAGMLRLELALDTTLAAVCDRCGEVESYPFVSRQNRFTACPRCGAIAYATDFERVKVPPTRQRSGVGERVKRCRHCGHTDSEDFQLPRTGDDSGAGALAAGAILGSLASRGLGGGGGGGFSGGSFGGGSFGGGGSTGSW